MRIMGVCETVKLPMRLVFCAGDAAGSTMSDLLLRLGRAGFAERRRAMAATHSYKEQNQAEQRALLFGLSSTIYPYFFGKPVQIL